MSLLLACGSDGSSPRPPIDADLDGFVAACDGGDDCDDGNAAVNPDVEEVCGNSADDNCDGGAMECSPWGRRNVRDADVVLRGFPPDVTELTAGSAQSTLLGSDVTGDGMADVIIGAPYNPLATVLVAPGPVSGAISLDDVMKLHPTLEEDDRFGAALAVADVDLDGLTDLIVGGSDSAEPVSVFRGPITDDLTTDQAALTLFLFVHYGYTALGSPLAVSDVTGDGIPDIVVGDPYWYPYDDADVEQGRIAVFRADQTGVIDTEDWDAQIVDDAEGRFMDDLVAGDLDGDGISEVIMGEHTEYYYSDWVDFPGTVKIVKGPVDGVVGISEADVVLEGELLDEASAAMAIGDTDGDGNPDLSVGAPGFSRCYVATDFSDGKHFLEDGSWIDGDADGYVGTSVAAGDADGDGFDDVFVGISNLGADSRPGSAYLVRGPIRGVVSATDALGTYDGEMIGDHAGNPVALADLNADAFADLLIGAPFNDGGGEDAVAVYAFFGGPSF